MNKKIVGLTFTAIFAALLSILSVVSVPIGPVPITMSLLAIFIISMILRPKYSVTATLVYITLGAIGLPIFSGFRSGVQTLVGATGGFIVAYPLMALLISFAVVRLGRKVWVCAASGAVSLIVCYLLGTVWFMIVADSTFIAALTACVIPFVAVDTLKLVAACAVTAALEKTGVCRRIDNIT